MKQRLCICGGGNLGQVIAGYISAKGKASVSVLTRRPKEWKNDLKTLLPEGIELTGHLEVVSSDPAMALKDANIVLFCLPGNANREELLKIKPFVTPEMYVGCVFASSGFFFEAMNILDANIPLWGFQRVPFISRIEKYGERARLMGYKSNYNIAVEHSENKEDFRKTIEELFERPTFLLTNYYEATFTNSNPLLHTSRLYSLFKDWKEGIYYDHNFLFYEEWTTEAAEILAAMDNELFAILDKLPVRQGYLTPILEYYESTTPEQMAIKIRSLDGLKGISSPMIETPQGWIPDLGSRYFHEEFEYSLKYIYEKGKELNISMPTIEKVFLWGQGMIKKEK